MLKKNILIVVKGYKNENFKKQPWFWLNSFIEKKLKNKFNIYILTDETPFKNNPYNFIKEPSYFNNYVSNFIEGYNFHAIYFIVNPLSLLMFWRFRRFKNLILIFGVARFELKNILMLSIKNFWIEKKLILIPVISSLIPLFVIKFFFNLTKAKKIIHLSKSSYELFKNNGFKKNSYYYQDILNPIFKKNSNSISTNNINISYFGPPLFSRGVDYVLDSFNKICDQNIHHLNSKVILNFYLRIGNDKDIYSNSLKKLLQLINQSKYKNNIHISTKFLTNNQILSKMKRSKIILLPFKITVSDLPIVVYEAGAHSNNLIVLNTNGVSEIANKFNGYIANNFDEIVFYLKHILNTNEKI